MAATGMYTRTFHPNFVGITAAALVIVVLLAAVIYLVRRFASRNTRPS
jgi:hypothetical protein